MISSEIRLPTNNSVQFSINLRFVRCKLNVLMGACQEISASEGNGSRLWFEFRVELFSILQRDLAGQDVYARRLAH